MFDKSSYGESAGSVARDHLEQKLWRRRIHKQRFQGRIQSRSSSNARRFFFENNSQSSEESADSTAGDSQWQFQDDPTAMVFSLRQIIVGHAAVTHVTHDSDDGAWQFIEAVNPQEEDGCVCTLEEMILIDSSLIEIADLPLGWRAIRSEIGAPWRVEKNPFDGT